MSAFASANAHGPLHASLTWGNNWGGGEGDGGGGDYTAFEVSSIGALYSVTHTTSRYFMDHNSGSRFESNRLVELTITESSVHVLFDGTWYEFSDGEHDSYPGTFEVNLERIPLTKDWMLEGVGELNESYHDDKGYHYHSEGICRVW